MREIAWLVCSLVVLFTIRRYVFWFASLLPRRDSRPDRTKSIVVVTAARNEETLLPRFMAAIERFDYPAHLVSFVLVSDASTDSTVTQMQDWCAAHDRARTVDLPKRRGKAAAIAAGLALAPPSDLVVILDADSEPAPDALACLAGAFRDPAVGAACGYPSPGNAHVSITARYAALERWVYHLVLLAGKDRLNLNPPAIGVLCAFRRKAFDEIGGFPEAAAEDICITMELAKRGWRTRWVAAARTREDVPTDFSGFHAQRMRWSRGMISTARGMSSVEDLLVAAGYLDRLALAAGIGLAVAGWIPWTIPAVYLLAPAVTILTALARVRPANWLWYLLAAPPMLAADIAVTAASWAAHLAGIRIDWAQRRISDAEGEG
jgi:cellulose synthase/poly-beta-1,6-N-acetylglucosamine synthase-like glycosyltransferase